MKIMNIIEFQMKDMQIIKILRFNARIIKNIITQKITRWYKNNEKLRISLANHSNHENVRIPGETQENYEHPNIPLENHKNIKHPRIPYENYENH